MNFSCLNISQLEVVVKCMTLVFCQWKLNSLQKAEILRLPGLCGSCWLTEKTSQKVPYKVFALPVSWHVRSGLLLPCVTRSAVTLRNTKYCNTNSVTLRNAKVLSLWCSVTLCSLADCLTQLDLGSKAHNGATHRLLTKFLGVCVHMRACTCVHIVYVVVALIYIHSGKVLFQKLLHSRSCSFNWESVRKSTKFAPLLTKQLISWQISEMTTRV